MFFVSSKHMEVVGSMVGRAVDFFRRYILFINLDMI